MEILRNEFHISKEVRDACKFSDSLFASSGNVIFQNIKAVRIFTEKFNSLLDERGQSESRVSAGSVNAMGLIDEVFHYVCMLFRRDVFPSAFSDALNLLDAEFGKNKIDELLLSFMNDFPPVNVYNGKTSSSEYLSEKTLDTGTKKIRANREQVLEEMVLLCLANENPAFKKFSILFSDKNLLKNPLYKKTWNALKKYFKTLPSFGPFNHDLITLLKEPVVFSPESLRGQLEYIIKHWSDLLGDFLKKLLAALDTISEEEKAAWQGVGDINMSAYSYENLMKEYERFSADSDWMPKVVLMAKTVLVWLDQLSKKYERSITRLDEIPDQELDLLRDQGFTGLWLIGLWERSYASRRIKQINGNPEAAASAYSLHDYEIAENIGGWDALANLRTRLWQRGIRLASDMVPNHTGMDSKWIVEKPDVFIQRSDCPFPQYSFNGENLSLDSRVGIYLEDHYYSKTDCAVIFKRVDNYTGDVRYIYHGNDGTGMPWNDTAQIDFLNPHAREEVMQQIINVAKNFPIIRFDAAMVLAKKHIRRLWYPEPGHGGDIATRSETGLSTKQFNDAIPNEFWREVVDRISKEVPDTLLLAEAFWMMEGYFVRTLGMHRVYNSAFMNMLKKEENQKYRDTVKNTLKFDPQVLKRFVNFMNNPDEETAVAQFGKGDKYFGVCTLMVTMPGLPMFGHGQIEGFEEKYGMEYTKAYRNEVADEWLVGRHWHDIFPLLKNRWQFAQVENFLFYDLWNNGNVNENVFAYSNNVSGFRTLVFYNNKYDKAFGWIKQSCEYAIKTGSGENDRAFVSKSISEGLNLNADDNKFCILFEQRSSLWFVRKSSDICNNGMFVSLNGFESQVYMNIHQVEDTSDKKWSTLCTVLAGKGCKNLEIEWEEIKYRELYEKFNAFLKAFLQDEINLIDELNEKHLTKKIVLDKTKNISENSKMSALDFYECANKFIIQEALDKKCIAPTKQFLSFKNLLTEILKLILDNHSKINNLSKQNSKTLQGYATLLKVKTRNEFIQKYFSLEKNNCLLLICYASISELANIECVEHFSLARKFFEVINTFNKEYNNKKNLAVLEENFIMKLKNIFLLAPTARKILTSKSKMQLASDVASVLVNSKNSSFFCGKNLFDGVQWFKGEVFDVSLANIFALALLNASSSQEQDVIKLYRVLADAKEKASYKCELFVKQFAKKNQAKNSSTRVQTLTSSIRQSNGKNKEKTMAATTVKKPATKKPAAKKTTTAKKATTAKKPAAKKTTTAKKATTAKKPAAKKSTTAKKATTAKKPAAKKTTTAKKATTTKKTTSTKKPAAKKTTTKKTTTKK